MDIISQVEKSASRLINPADKIEVYRAALVCLHKQLLQTQEMIDRIGGIINGTDSKQI